VAADRSIQHAGDGVQLDVASHQSRLRWTRRLVIHSDTQEAMRRHRLVAALDTHQLRFAQHGGMFNQSRGGITEHHPPGGATDSIRWAIPTCSPMVV